MEVSVSFTDGSVDPGAAGGSRYMIDETPVGRAWIAAEGLILSSPARVRYEKHPWMEKFEFDGIKAAPAKRTGTGTKDAKGFVRSLSTIYSAAYDDYTAFGGDEAFDARAYFSNAAQYFAAQAASGGGSRMTARFCGFTENIWREGNSEMLDICTGAILPVIMSEEPMRNIFEENITEEFREYLAGAQRSGS